MSVMESLVPPWSFSLKYMMHIPDLFYRYWNPYQMEEVNYMMTMSM